MRGEEVVVAPALSICWAKKFARALTLALPFATSSFIVSGSIFVLPVVFAVRTTRTVVAVSVGELVALLLWCLWWCF